MVILDSYSLIALLADEPAADEVEGLIREHDTGMTAANLAEVIDVMQRRYKLPPEDVESSVDPLFASEVELLPIGGLEAWRAGVLRAAHYHRRLRPLSLADCFLLAAVGDEDRVATADQDVTDVARLEQIDVFPLPDSAGRRP